MFHHFFGQAGGIQFARPNADISAGTWTPSTGATLYGCIDEVSRSDTDFIQAQASQASDCTIGLSAVSDPGMDTDHVLRYAYRNTGTGTTVTVYLYDGATEIANWGEETPTTSFALVERILTSEQADAISGAGYAGALRVRLLQNPGVSANIEVSWAELEVPG